MEKTSSDGVYAVSNLTEAYSTLDASPVCPQIDQESPAFAHIVRELAAMRLAGLDLGEREVEIAIAVGEWKAQRTPYLGAFGKPELPAQPGAVVYYVRRGRLIKIGTTRQLQRRLSELVPDEVLAVEPGDRITEQARHAQFRHLAVGREYFEDCTELRDHIGRIVETHGTPNVPYHPLPA